MGRRRARGSAQRLYEGKRSKEVPFRDRTVEDEVEEVPFTGEE